MGTVGGTAAATAVAVVGNAASAVASSIPYTVGTGGPVNGVLARMTGITPNNPIGAGWEIATGVILKALAFTVDVRKTRLVTKFKSPDV